MAESFWGLTLAYWLHMLATVTWIGSLAALALIVLPSAGKVLDKTAYAILLGDLQRRLDGLGWFSLAVLVGTGLLQMSANPNYHGFLAISNRWAVAILLKHVMVVVMAGVSAFLTWIVLPSLRRVALRLERLGSATDVAQIQEASSAIQANARLIRLNLLLSVFVLALTAIARVG